MSVFLYLIDTHIYIHTAKRGARLWTRWKGYIFILSFNTYHVSFKLNRVLFIEVYNVSSQHEIRIVQTTCFIVKNRWFTVAKTKGEIQIWSYRYLRKAFFMFWQCRLLGFAKQLTNCIRTLHKLSHLKKYEKKILDIRWNLRIHNEGWFHYYGSVCLLDVFCP